MNRANPLHCSFDSGTRCSRVFCLSSKELSLVTEGTLKFAEKAFDSSIQFAVFVVHRINVVLNLAIPDSDYLALAGETIKSPDTCVVWGRKLGRP